MKKLLLSGAVIGLFFFYGLHQKEEADNVQVIAPPLPQSHPTITVTVPSPQGSTGNPPTPRISSGISPQPTIPTAVPTNPPVQKGQYKDGTYTGNAADAFYGNIQVQVSIGGGKISDVNFLQYPNDRGTSIMINQQAMPYLKQEAIQAQSANVDIVSGATDSSMAFRQSLQSALAQAQ